jgi:hypothetical protein
MNTSPLERKTLSDGSSTDYYKIPSWATDLIDLIEHKKMNFAIGNIFKACYRLGEKDGIDRAYDLRKIIFFAQRELAAIEREQQSITAEQRREAEEELFERLLVRWDIQK